MPFCYSPWTNIDLSPVGVMSPCCKFQTTEYDKTYNIQSDNFDDYVSSNFLKQVKAEFTNGNWPVGCTRCQIEEDNNIDSKRILDYHRWQDQYKEYDLMSNKFITASIAFGNTCNLKCITCNPTSSSRWQKEYKDLYNIEVKHFKFYKKDFIQTFINAAPNITHLDIPGGEPFLSGVDEQKKLLKHYIDNNQADSITLHYTTNATIFPDDEWWELWKHFKEIDLQISLDGINHRYEYIRFPGNWNEVLFNVEKYIKIESNNVRLSVSHTVSSYNIYYLDEFFNWCKQIGLPTPWLGRVHKPAYMRPTVWPEPFKHQLINKLKSSKYPEVQNWAMLINNVDDSEQYDLFCDTLHKHDHYRNTTFVHAFPEIASWIK
jgi:MoaA/NifB/PqqE/SkfB family radical SAM enzyme